MVELDANRIVELFEKNVSARKRLAELIVIEPDIRLAIINAIIRDKMKIIFKNSKFSFF